MGVRRLSVVGLAALHRAERPGDGGAVPVKGGAGARESCGCSAGSPSTWPGRGSRAVPPAVPVCRDAARTVHETYATTLAVGSDIGGEEGLAVDHYVGYLAAGQALAAGRRGERPVPRRRSTALNGAGPAVRPDSCLASIWIADLNHPDGRPDRGLALIDASVIETVPAPETFGLHGSPSHPNATGTTRP